MAAIRGTILSIRVVPLGEDLQPSGPGGEIRGKFGVVSEFNFPHPTEPDPARVISFKAKNISFTSRLIWAEPRRSVAIRYLFGPFGKHRRPKTLQKPLNRPLTRSTTRGGYA
jgi:hypothetical protein